MAIVNYSINNGNNIGYRDDPTSRTVLPQESVESPIHHSLRNTNTGSGYEAHSYQYINKYKVCKLRIVGWSGPTNFDENWRTFSGIGVDGRVLLWPETKEWELSYENKYEQAYAKLDSMGLLSKVSQLAEGLRTMAQLGGMAGAMGRAGIPVGGRFISRFKEAPAWSGATPLSLPGSLKFNFKFGQAGLFNAKEEVVKPILALALPFAPTRNGQYMRGPVATAPTYFLNYLLSLRGASVVDAFKKARSAGEASGEEGIARLAVDAIGTITNLETAVRRAMDEAIQTTLIQTGRFVQVEIGRLKFPSMKVGSVQWKFDMTHTDEYGYPFAGSITLGGLEAIELVNQATVALTVDGINRNITREKPPTGTIFDRNLNDDDPEIQ